MIFDSLISKTDNRTINSNVSYFSHTHPNSHHSNLYKYEILSVQVQRKDSDCGCNKKSEILTLKDDRYSTIEDINISNSPPGPVPINEYSPQLSNVMFGNTMQDKRDIPFPITE
jgi:hypothetical protein